MCRSGNVAGVPVLTCALVDTSCAPPVLPYQNPNKDKCNGCQEEGHEEGEEGEEGHEEEGQEVALAHFSGFRSRA